MAVQDAHSYKNDQLTEGVSGFISSDEDRKNVCDPGGITDAVRNRLISG